MMIAELVVSALTLLLITGLTIWLVMQPQKRILRIALPLFVISFLVIYVFYLIALMVPDGAVYGIPAAFAAFAETFASFTNGIAYSDLVDSEAMQGIVGTLWFETVFWALHLIVIVTIAVSGFAVFGRQFMDRVRLALIQRFDGKREIYCIFGDTEGAVTLGKNIAQEKDRPFVVFFSDDYQEELREQIASFGGALIEIDPSSRDALIEKMSERYPENCAVFEGADHVKVNGTYVSDLIARKTVQDHAPYQSFGLESGFPETPYRAVILGFGELGRACASWIIANAQLNPNGTKPELHIVSKDPIGYERFLIENPAIEACATLTFTCTDAFSFTCKDVLEQAACGTISLGHVYITCAPIHSLNSAEGERHHERNAELREHVRGILARTGKYTEDRLETMLVSPYASCKEIWTPSIVLHQELDLRAMRMNGWYSLDEEDMGKPRPEREQLIRAAWKKASEFDKDSSRASCDFLDTIAAMMGLDADAISAEEFKHKLQEPALLNALAKVEHLRWCAFLYAHGYTPMGQEEFEQRIEAHEQARAAGKKSSGKPHCDTSAKRHACLVGWDELPNLEPLYCRYDEKIAQGKATIQGRDEENVKNLDRII